MPAETAPRLRLIEGRRTGLANVLVPAVLAVRLLLGLAAWVLIRTSNGSRFVVRPQQRRTVV